MSSSYTESVSDHALSKIHCQKRDYVYLIITSVALIGITGIAVYFVLTPWPESPPDIIEEFNNIGASVKSNETTVTITANGTTEKTKTELTGNSNVSTDYETTEMMSYSTTVEEKGRHAALQLTKSSSWINRTQTIPTVLYNASRSNLSSTDSIEM